MRIKDFKRSEFIIPTIYLFVILFCLFFTVPLTEYNLDWFFYLMFLTLPWSVVTFFLIVGAIHNGGSNEATIILVTITSLLNAFLFYIAARLIRTRKEKKFDKNSVSVIENDRQHSLG